MRLLGKCQGGLLVEHWLCHHELRTRCSFSPQQLNLRFKWLTVGVANNTEQQTWEGFQHSFTFPSIAAIQVSDYLEQAEGINIMHRAGARTAILRQLVAAKGHDRLDTERAGTE